MGDPRTTGAHSVGYQEESQQSGAQGRGATGQYPSESVEYGRGDTGQYPSQSAEYGRGEGRHAGTRGVREAGEYRGDRAVAEYPRYQGLAAALLILSGLVSFFAGITAVIKAGFYRVPANYPFNYSIKSWGITELVIGGIVFAVGVCLLLGMRWARYAAIALAVVSAIWNFMFLPFYPFWSIVVIALDIFIIWACAREDPGRREYA